MHLQHAAYPVQRSESEIRSARCECRGPVDGGPRGLADTSVPRLLFSRILLVRQLLGTQTTNRSETGAAAP